MTTMVCIHKLISTISRQRGPLRIVCELLALEVCQEHLIIFPSQSPTIPAPRARSRICLTATLARTPARASPGWRSYSCMWVLAIRNVNCPAPRFPKRAKSQTLAKMLVLVNSPSIMICSSGRNDGHSTTDELIRLKRIRPWFEVIDIFHQRFLKERNCGLKSRRTSPHNYYGRLRFLIDTEVGCGNQNNLILSTSSLRSDASGWCKKRTNRPRLSQSEPAFRGILFVTLSTCNLSLLRVKGHRL